MNVRTKLSPSSAPARSSSPRAIASLGDGATSTVWVYDARPSKIEDTLTFDFIGIARVTSLSEGQRVANGLDTQLSTFP